MEHWSGQAVTGISDAYGLMEDLLQIQERDEDEENLYYSRYDLRQQGDEDEEVLEDYDDEDEDEDEDDFDDDEDLDDDEDD